MVTMTQTKTFRLGTLAMATLITQSHLVTTILTVHNVLLTT